MKPGRGEIEGSCESFQCKLEAPESRRFLAWMKKAPRALLALRELAAASAGAQPLH